MGFFSRIRDNISDTARSVANVARDTSAFFVGGTSGVNIARGEAPTAQTLAVDAAGLAAGAGIAATGLAASSAVTGGVASAGLKIGERVLDVAAARAARGPGQADVSPVYSEPWQSPGATSITPNDVAGRSALAAQMPFLIGALALIFFAVLLLRR